MRLSVALRRCAGQPVSRHQRAEQISAIRSNAHMFLIGNSLFYIPLAAVNVFRFTIQGLSYSMLAVFAGVFEMVARSVMGFCLVPVLGYPAVCFASPTAWIGRRSLPDPLLPLCHPQTPHAPCCGRSSGGGTRNHPH